MKEKKKFLSRIVAGCMALLVGMTVLPANVYAKAPNLNTPYTSLTVGNTQLKMEDYNDDYNTILGCFEAPETGKYSITISNNGDYTSDYYLLDEDLSRFDSSSRVSSLGWYRFNELSLKKGEKVYIYVETSYAYLESGKLVAAKINIKQTKTTSKLNKTAVSLASGEKANLKLSNNKEKIIWVSSDKKVATVNSKGVVTAKKQGTAYIYAIAKHKLYKCKVSVYR